VPENQAESGVEAAKCPMGYCSGGCSLELGDVVTCVLALRYNKTSAAENALYPVSQGRNVRSLIVTRVRLDTTAWHAV